MVKGLLTGCGLQGYKPSPSVFIRSIQQLKLSVLFQVVACLFVHFAIPYVLVERVWKVS